MGDTSVDYANLANDIFQTFDQGSSDDVPVKAKTKAKKGSAKAKKGTAKAKKGSAKAAAPSAVPEKEEDKKEKKKTAKAKTKKAPVKAKSENKVVEDDEEDDVTMTTVPPAPKKKAKTKKKKAKKMEVERTDSPVPASDSEDEGEKEDDDVEMEERKTGGVRKVMGDADLPYDDEIIAMTLSACEPLGLLTRLAGTVGLSNKDLKNLLNDMNLGRTPRTSHKLLQLLAAAMRVSEAVKATGNANRSKIASTAPNGTDPGTSLEIKV